MFRASLVSGVAILASCGARPPAPAPSNQGGDVSAPAATDASLTGPFARVELVPALESPTEEPTQVTSLGSATSPDESISVSLLEYRSSWASAGCLVVLRTRDGFFAGKDFLCSADRSDEVVVTDAVSIEIEDTTARIRFRTSYQLDGAAPDPRPYAITCTLAPVLSCTPPPAIGGYD